MYCNNCGTKNPDNANFCNSCGSRLTGGSGNRNTQTTNRSVGKKGGFLRSCLVSLVVFALCYVGSYVLTTLSSRNDTPASKSEAGLIQVATTPAASRQEETQAYAQKDSGYIANLDGYWEEVRLQDGSFNLNVNALTFTQTVYNCTGLTVNMDVQMNAGTSCKDWQLWGRSGNSYVKLAKIYLPAGDGSVSQSVTFSTPVTFDSVAVTPTIVGSYSWSMSLGITDVWTD